MKPGDLAAVVGSSEDDLTKIMAQRGMIVTVASTEQMITMNSGSTVRGYYIEPVSFSWLEDTVTCFAVSSHCLRKIDGFERGSWKEIVRHTGWSPTEEICHVEREEV